MIVSRFERFRLFEIFRTILLVGSHNAGIKSKPRVHFEKIRLVDGLEECAALSTGEVESNNATILG